MTIIIEIKVKGSSESFEAFKDYLDNAMRHMADDWEINQCLHDNPYVVDKDTFT
jgi:hypothetical protein